MSSHHTRLNDYFSSIEVGQRGFASRAELSDFSSAEYTATLPDLICFSHTSWDCIDRSLQHLLIGYAARQRTFFIEEAVLASSASWRLETRRQEFGVRVIVPHLPSGLSPELTNAMQQSLIDELLTQFGIAQPIVCQITQGTLSFPNH